MEIYRKTPNGAVVALRTGDIIPLEAGYWSGHGFPPGGETGRRDSSWVGGANHWAKLAMGTLKMMTSGYTWWPTSLLKDAGLIDVKNDFGEVAL